MVQNPLKKILLFTFTSLFATGLAFGKNDPDKKPGKDDDKSFTIEELILGFDEPIQKAYQTGEYLVLEVGEGKDSDVYVQYPGEDKPVKVSDNGDFDGNSIAINNKVIYESHILGNSNMYIFDIPTKKHNLLARGKFTSPSITADGKLLYLIQTIGEKKNKHNEVVVFDMKTTDLKVLSKTLEDEVALAIDPTGKYLSVVYSPTKKTQRIEMYVLSEDNFELELAGRNRPKINLPVKKNKGVIIEKEADYTVKDMTFIGDSGFIYQISKPEYTDIRYFSDISSKLQSWNTARSKQLKKSEYMGSMVVSATGDVAYLDELSSGKAKVCVKNIFKSTRCGDIILKKQLMEEAAFVPIYFNSDATKIVVYDETLQHINYEVANPAIPK